MAGRAFALSMNLRLDSSLGTMLDTRSHSRLAFTTSLAQVTIMEPPNDKSGDDHERGVALEALRAPLIDCFRRRVRQQDEVLDLVQEVFLRLSNRGHFDDIAHLRGYVFQVVASVLTDRQRRRVVRHEDAHVVFDPERIGEPEIGPDRIVAGREARRAARIALDQLPDGARTISVLRRLEGMRYLKIAKRLGLSVSAVEKHTVRAVAHLAATGDIR